MSFDLNDDLCELILSYLSIEDRVRLECVSKQWHQLIYRSVHKFSLPLPRGSIPITSHQISAHIWKAQEY
ncbi:unnamed protein product [Oppiella nova]|uniref:F-box domain-containing protein n=1 Tax=Oppiella nova TaxID=334625 RepID=A0A7R9M617_9ACAR|nr:unnamed protein product [Oppiella nova]CAG2170141.1 unnamed protein product [Oppiella nova]